MAAARRAILWPLLLVGVAQLPGLRAHAESCADADGCPAGGFAAQIARAQADADGGSADGVAVLQLARPAASLAAASGRDQEKLALQGVRSIPKNHPGVVTVASWNLACFEQAMPSEIATTLATVGADIIATSEDIEFNSTTQDKALNISGYTKVVACRGEALWDSERAYAWGGRYLQNALYARDDAMVHVRNFTANISAPEVVGDYLRCAAVADFLPKDQEWNSHGLPLRVAAVHLTGGRFVDMNFEKYSGEKGHEIRAAAALLPDMIVGDFNSYPTEAQVTQYQQSYEPYIDATERGELRQYMGWALDGTEEADRAGYLRLQNFQNTTYYGGTVDQHYLRPHSFRFYPAFEVINTSFEQSDHAIVASALTSA